MSETRTISGSQSLSHANWLKFVSEQIGTLRYGTVEIIVHDSQVTQIEKTERLRLDKAANGARPNRGE
jgi:hypothetical protein